MESRSFADHLRSLTDEAMLELFALRPDLISPVPPDVASLSVRLNSLPSLTRAVESLNAWEFQVLESCAVLTEPFAIKDVIALTHKSAAAVVEKLQSLALVYGEGKELRLPSSLREAIGPEPARLGPPSMVKLSLKKLADAPMEAAELLKKLTWSAPRGTIGDSKNPPAGMSWLIQEKFLIPFDSRTVILPREVALHLRGGKTHQEFLHTAPEIAGRKVSQKEVDVSAIANISTILRWSEEVLNFWSEEAPSALRAGGLGIRDLKAISTHLGVDESCAAFIAELLFISGLVSIDLQDEILPTHAFDLWLSQTPERKWLTLTESWLITSRVSGLVGKGDGKNLAALGPELDRVNTARIKSLVLRVLAESPGVCVTPTSLNAYLTWLAPSRRKNSLQEEMVSWSAREAEWLGLTGQGAISSFALGLLSESQSLGIDAALPKPVDHILIQSDNTAIAPGPLVMEVSQILDSIADIESRGGATVFRFSESSIRRGLDHGRTGDDIKAFLKKTSKTPIPQPLDYLITDIAKRHGRLRVGAANTYVRCEDPALIAEILSDKKLEALRFRKLASEVLISEVAAHEVILALRAASYLPAAEAANGIILGGPKSARAKAKPRPPRILGDIEKPTLPMFHAALRTIRAGEKSAQKQSTLRNVANQALGQLPRTTANETLDLLATFIKEQQTLSIGYADNNGAVTHRIIDPINISAGTLLARDHATGEVQTFRIPRITGVAAL